MSVPPATAQAEYPNAAPGSPTAARISFEALAHNVALVRRSIPQASQIIAIVKANAYGHGSVPISRELVRLGVARLGVATVQEGMALRQGGIEAPILVLGALFEEQLSDLIEHRLTPMIADGCLVPALAKRLGPRDAPYPVHVKVETGMGRLGLPPEAVLDLLQSEWFKGPLQAVGVLTHLAESENSDPAYTNRQLERFHVLVTQLESAGLSVPLVHAANTAAILRHPKAHFTAVRPGLMLYGYHTLPPGQALPDLRPVLSLHTRIAAMRPLEPGESVSYNRTFTARRRSRIAVLPIGYADGYSRRFSNHAHVLIRGRRAPVVGRVCMDFTMVDVTEIPEANPGVEVVVIGKDGQESITAQDLAGWQETIPYEVLCGLGPRIAREYVSPPRK